MRVNDFRCYEAKIEENEKASSCQEPNPGPWQPLSICRQNSVRDSPENSLHQERNYAEWFTHSKCSEHLASRWSYEAKIEESEKVWLRPSVTEAFSTTCAVHIEDVESWWLSGYCGSVAEHCRLKPEVFWVRLPATAGFFTFLYFRLITSKLIYFQREARCSEHVSVCTNIITVVAGPCMQMLSFFCSTLSLFILICKPQKYL